MSCPDRKTLLALQTGDLSEQAAETVSREIGDLLEYRIDHKVTIPRNRSALLPIATGAMRAKDTPMRTTARSCSGLAPTNSAL